MLLLETAQAQSCSVPREGTMCCHCSCLEKRGLLALLSPQLGQAVWSGQEATSSTAPPAPFPPQQPLSLPWPGPLLASHRKDTVRGRVQILGALSFSFFWLTGLFPLHACALPLPFPSVSAHRITSKNPSAAADHVHQESLWKRGWEPWCSGEPGSRQSPLAAPASPCCPS